MKTNKIILKSRRFKRKLDKQLVACEALLMKNRYNSVLPLTSEVQPSEAELQLMHFFFKIEGDRTWMKIL